MKFVSFLSLAALPILGLGQVIITPTTVTRTTVTATPPPSSSSASSSAPATPPSSSSSASSSVPSSSPSSSVPATPPLPAPTTPTVNTTVSYDAAYGTASGSLRTVACSDGANGLLTRGFTTFGSLPNFPNIGGAFAVAGWNSTSCGTCWELAYTNNGTTSRINVTAIDVAINSFNVALPALNTLTGGRGVELGRVPVVARQVAASACGL